MFSVMIHDAGAEDVEFNQTHTLKEWEFLRRAQRSILVGFTSCTGDNSIVGPRPLVKRQTFFLQGTTASVIKFCLEYGLERRACAR